VPTTDPDVVERTVHIAAKPETVFPFFTDPVKMIQWKGMDASLDARPGGIYRVNVTGRDIAVGEYVEITPYTRVVFTWGWENSPIAPGSTTVEVDLIPEGDGTLVRLRHRGLVGAAAGEHAAGWEHFLPRLVEIAEGRDPGPDPWIQAPPQDVTHAPNAG
jgi:uncharacterized protein YndB with AHSA1/START domain